MKSFAATHLGLTRRSNQDRFLCDDKLRLYAVADGMGGHLGGDVAAQIAIDTLVSDMAAVQDTVFHSRVFNDVPNRAHKAILTRMGEDNKLHRMGTTFTAAKIRFSLKFPDQCDVEIAHVGDSVAMLLHRKDNWKVNVLTECQGVDNRLTNCLGVNPTAFHGAQRYSIPVPAQRGHVLLLASDGLTKELHPHKIRELAFAGPIEGATDRLVNAALAHGGSDNITVVLVYFGL